MSWRTGLVLGSLALVACGGDARTQRKSEAVQGAIGQTQDPPSTREEFLAALAPLPGPRVRIVYDVDGPGTLAGTLEVLATPGGFRRENWSLSRATGAGEPTQTRGTTIQTPDRLWSALDGEPGIEARSPIGAVADAYLSLDAGDRLKATESLRRWQADLARARVEHPGDTATVADQTCLRMRVAAQELCLWEQTGLPLEYRGAEFSVTATRVELEAEFDLEAFTFPADAQRARTVELPERLRVEPRASVDALANGDYASLAIVLTPGLRLPLPGGDDEW